MKFPVATAIRECFREGYSFANLKSDLISGIIVGLVALPLGMALAIATGVAPQHGLYTVIVAGAVVALLGGSRYQVTGPTAAFVVILAPIVHHSGIEGLMVAGLFAGILLLAMSLLKVGKFIHLIPPAVTLGFTSGIAVVIASIQIKDLLGLKFQSQPETFFQRIHEILASLPSFSFAEFTVGLASLISLFLWPRLRSRIPAPFVVITLSTIACTSLHALFPALDFNTIASQFTYSLGGITGSGIPPFTPQFHTPWSSFSSLFEGSKLLQLLPGIVAISLLGSIESLLSAVIADRMTNTKHNPDSELFALGIGNLLCPFFGGIPATGAIARTATNIRFGALSPLSAIFHSIFVLLVIVLFANQVSLIPMSVLAALLIFVAYNMSEAPYFVELIKKGALLDKTVLLVTFALTIVFDMVTGVFGGLILYFLMNKFSFFHTDILKSKDSSHSKSEGFPHREYLQTSNR